MVCNTIYSQMLKPVNKWIYDVLKELFTGPWRDHREMRTAVVMKASFRGAKLSAWCDPNHVFSIFFANAQHIWSNDCCRSGHISQQNGDWQFLEESETNANKFLSMTTREHLKYHYFVYTTSLWLSSWSMYVCIVREAAWTRENSIRLHVVTNELVIYYLARCMSCIYLLW